jgi:DNA primase
MFVSDDRHEELIMLLEDFLGDSRKHYESRGQISFDCPNCSYEKGLDHDGKGNLEINYELGVYNCWACAETDGTKGRLFHLFKQYADKETLRRFINGHFTFDSDYYEDEEVEVSKTVLNLPDGFYYLSGKQGHSLFISAFNYLYTRGITDEIISKYKLGFCLDGKYQNRIIIPSYDIDGDLNYFVARSINKFNTKYKYLNPDVDKTSIVFNEHLINWDRPIFLVEGAFDHIVIPNSIPLLGKKMYDKLLDYIYHKANSYVIIVLDPDANEDAVKIYNKLDSGKLMNRILINRLPEEHDISSFNQTYGQDNLKEWLRNKTTKIID